MFHLQQLPLRLLLHLHRLQRRELHKNTISGEKLWIKDWKKKRN
jgi:hypothetical protein